MGGVPVQTSAVISSAFWGGICAGRLLWAALSHTVSSGWPVLAADGNPNPNPNPNPSPNPNPNPNPNPKPDPNPNPDPDQVSATVDAEGTAAFQMARITT